MNRLDLLRKYVKDLHTELSQALEGVTLDQLQWQPPHTANAMAFVVWHCARTEDIIINVPLMGKRSTILSENGWDKKFNIDPRVQGTGMPHNDAEKIRFQSVGDARTYLSQVFSNTESYLDNITDDDLDKKARIRRAPVMALEEAPVWDILCTNILTHEFSHLGELWALRGIQGLQGAGF